MISESLDNEQTNQAARLEVTTTATATTQLAQSKGGKRNLMLWSENEKSFELAIAKLANQI